MKWLLEFLLILPTISIINIHSREQLFRNIECADLHYPKFLSDGALSLLKGVN
jgi:hypothetical protein